MTKSIYILIFCLSLTISSIAWCEDKNNDFSDYDQLLIEEIEADYNGEQSEGSVDNHADEDLLDNDLLDGGLIQNETSNEPATEKTFDPVEPVNRAFFYFNDKVYIYVFTPVSKGYVKITPKFARTGIKNFFSNLGSPLRVVNNLLQGKIKNAGAETGRFFVNTFLGFLGFIDSAKVFKPLNPPEEDLGQTFGKWGIGNGPYLVIPFLGPSTLRDSAGMVGEFYINPVFYAYDLNSREKLIMDATEATNSMPSRMDLYKTLKDSALDPYTAARNAYMQIRKEQIKK